MAAAAANSSVGPAGEAALLAAVQAPRTGRMADIVATIQAEQDRIIRADQAGIMVVQGGPGTGKTAVALHRAAYLLYNHRAQLEQRGVLIIGPNPTFLGYISQVLPSLGENAVVLSTIADLFPGVYARGSEEPAGGQGQGPHGDDDRDRQRRAAPAGDAVQDRSRCASTVRPDGSLQLDRGAAHRRPGPRLGLPPAAQQGPCGVRQAGHRRPGRPGRRAARPRPRTARAWPPRDDLDAIRQDLLEHEGLRDALRGVWPVLTAQRLLADLYASPDRLAFAADGLTAGDRGAAGPAGSAPPNWTRRRRAAAGRGGGDPRARSTVSAAAADGAADLDYASEVLDLMGGGESPTRPNSDEVGLVSMVSAANLADLHAEVADWTSTAERAAADREWTYGHVIVDEAQELSAMAWRMVMRRCPMRSMTLVGDLAQTSDPAGASSWARVLRPYARQGFRVEELTVNYRTPAEIMTVAEPVLAAIDPALTAPTSVRDAGVSPVPPARRSRRTCRPRWRGR